MFRNKKEAGEKLAEKLKKYREKDNTLILSIPCGGGPVANEVAKDLGLPMDLLVVRKLPMPENPEAGLGAISETGEIIWQSQADFYSSEIIEKILSEQTKEIKRRIKVLRQGRSLPEIKGRVVILVDDGLAMGSTMEAAVLTLKKLEAKKIIVAVPVGSIEAIKRIKDLADQVICLETPYPFYAVAQGYYYWHNVTDDEVIEIIQKFKRENNS